MIEKKGLRLSKLTLGTVQLGSSYGIANHSGKPDETESVRLLDKAVNGGITSYDTASAYGESERVLGDYFSGKEKPEPVFVSKMTLTAGPQSTRAEVERQMYESIESTLERLRIDKIPVMMLHNPDILRVHGQTVTTCFRRLIKDGLIDKAGVSFGAHIDEQYEQVWKIVQDSTYEAVQIPINILDHRLFNNDGLHRLRRTGKIVFARSIFLQGLLFLSPGRLPQHLQDAGEPIRLLRDLAASDGMSLAQMAVSFVRDLEEVDSLVIGAETEKQVSDNLHLIRGPRLSEHIRAQVMQTVGQLPAHILNPARWNA